MRKIVRNAIKCNICNTVIESKSVHDFVECKCGRCFVDGGLSYLRRGFQKPDDYTDMSETIEVES